MINETTGGRGRGVIEIMQKWCTDGLSTLPHLREVLVHTANYNFSYLSQLDPADPTRRQCIQSLAFDATLCQTGQAASIQRYYETFTGNTKDLEQQLHYLLSR